MNTTKLVEPAIAVSSIICGIVLGSVVSGLMIFGLSLLFLLLNVVSGLVINLWLPKINWENEVQVVKQSFQFCLQWCLTWLFLPLQLQLFDF